MAGKLQIIPRNTIQGSGNTVTETHEHSDVQYSLNTVTEIDDSSWSTQSPCSTGMPTNFGSELQSETILDVMAYNPQFDFGLHHFQWMHEGTNLEIRNILPDDMVSQGLALDDQTENALAGSFSVFDLSEANSRLLAGGQTFLDPNTAPASTEAVIDPNLKDSGQVLQCENFCHIDAISESAYTKVQQFFTWHHTAGFPECPSIDMIHAFTELYFEYFDHHFPCIHKRQLQGGAASWILLMAVASVGSQYSAIENAVIHTKYLQLLLDKAIHQYVSTKYAYFLCGI